MVGVVATVSARPLNAGALKRLTIRKPKALSADRPKPHSKRTADEYDRNRQYKLPI